MSYSLMERKYPIAMTGNPNDFALLMLFGVFVSYVCFRCRKGQAGGVISITVMVNCVFLVFWTESRANIIGLMLATAFFLLISFRKRAGVLAGFICIVVGISMLVPGLWEKVGLQLSDILVFDFSGQQMNSDTIRVNLIRNGFHFLYQTAGMGVGAGNLEYWMQNYSVYPTGGIINMHNWWMELLVDYGVVVFVGYCIFYVKLFRDIFRRFRQSDDPQMKAIAFGFLCCMVGFLIGSVSSSSIFHREFLWVFWAVAIAFQGQTENTAIESTPYRAKQTKYIRGAF